MRYRKEDLKRAFFSVRFSRMLDPLGYATFRRWRLYGEESLAGREAAIWLQEENLTLEHAGEPLSRYEVEHDAAGSRAGKLLAVRGQYNYLINPAHPDFASIEVSKPEPLDLDPRITDL